jgi:hypothetical protein
METNEIVNSQERKPVRGLGDGYEIINKSDPVFLRTRFDGNLS